MLDDDKFTDYIKTILTAVPKQGSIDTQITLRQLYEVEFGVFDHPAHEVARPLSVVGLYDTEENGQSSLLYARIEQFIKSNVNKYTGLDLHEFLKLPREIVQWVFKICEEKMKAEDEAYRSLQSHVDSIKEKK